MNGTASDQNAYSVLTWHYLIQYENGIAHEYASLDQLPMFVQW